MINLVDCTKEYKKEGLDEIYANAKVCQDIILAYIFKSSYKKHITLKGGLVMYNLTNDLRRATIDIDIDLIRISIADNKIHEIFSEDKIKGINIEVDKENITELKHQDYKGKSMPITVQDTFGNKLTTKIDVGVHTEYSIAQDELCFSTNVRDDSLTLMVNSKEQIFVEKMIPLLRFGAISTRYKDLFDLYWLIKNGELDRNKINHIMQKKILSTAINGIDNVKDLVQVFENVLRNQEFKNALANRKNNWLEVEAEELEKVIINYLKLLITVEV